MRVSAIRFVVGSSAGIGTLLVNTASQKPASNTSNTSKTPSDTRTQTVAKPGGSGAQEVLLVLLVLLAKMQGVLLGKRSPDLVPTGPTVFPVVLSTGGKTSLVAAG